MHIVSLFFVLWSYYSENKNHTREEVMSAINKIRSSHSQALLSVEILRTIIQMAAETPKDVADVDSEVQWEEDRQDEYDDIDFIYLAHANGFSVKPSIANKTFLHGMLISVYMPPALEVITPHLK